MTKKSLNKKVGKNNNTAINNNKDMFYGKVDQYYLLQTLMDNIPDNLYIKDKKNRFIMVNKVFADSISKKPEDFIGKTDLDFFPKDRVKEYSKDENRIIKSGKPITDKVEKLIHSGKEFWMSTSKVPWYDKNGNIMGTMGISRDVTERKKYENSTLGKEKSFFNAIMNNISDSIFFKDLDSRIVRLNRACAIKHGIENPEDAVGKTDFDFFSEEHAKQAFEDEQKIIKTNRPIIDFEEKETYQDNEYKWASTSKLPWYDENNNIIGIFGITRDITEKKKAGEKVKYLSFHDTLTGLYNRAYFDEELTRLDTERQLPITIVMGDLNGLKVINDAYGHAEGDILLKKISDILKDAFRKEDIISRWGGDEFIAILPKTSAKDTKNIINRIKELCKEKSTTGMPMSISLGVSTKKSPSENMDDILKEAEDKMYKNKIAESMPIHENLVQSLRSSLKKGDYRTEVRIKKMEDYAILIGERLNLSSIKLDELRLLMNLHNIGKLTLADEIMTKKGRLSSAEWKIIKEIPEMGYRIAESSTTLKPIAESILTHHEWYNGQGYPRGMRGKEIPVLSRISFLINSYDAMTSDRPYRKKMTEEAAKKEIKKFSGIQFDPKIVETFLELLKD